MRSTVEQFLTDMKKRGRSPQTIEHYRLYLQRFFEFSGAGNGAITQKNVSAFTQKLEIFTDKLGEPLTTKTINYHLIALRSFLLHLKKKGVQSLGADKVKLLEVADQKAVGLSKADIVAIRSALWANRGLNGARDAAVFEMLLSSGMSVSSLAQLNKADVASDFSYVQVEYPLGVEKIEISLQARKALAVYLGGRVDVDPSLFVSADKAREGIKRGGEKRLTARSIQRILKRYSDKISTTKDITPALVRNYVIANLVKTGAEPKDIAKKMGFKNVRSAAATIAKLPR